MGVDASMTSHMTSQKWLPNSGTYMALGISATKLVKTDFQTFCINFKVVELLREIISIFILLLVENLDFFGVVFELFLNFRNY